LKEEFVQDFKPAFLNAQDAKLKVFVVSPTTAQYSGSVGKSVGLVEESSEIVGEIVEKSNSAADKASQQKTANILDGDSFTKIQKDAKVLGEWTSRNSGVLAGVNQTQVGAFVKSLKAKNEVVAFVGKLDASSAKDVDVAIREGVEGETTTGGVVLGASKINLANLVSIIANGKRLREQPK